MAALAISQALAEAQLAASMALADTGAGASFVAFLDSDGLELGRVLLAKPCGSISAGALTLIQAEPGADLVMATGSAASAQWCSATGTLLASGAVTDAAGAGPFKLAGTSGTTLYAGGTITLDGLELS